jgi:hypothetical protein
MERNNYFRHAVPRKRDTTEKTTLGTIPVTTSTTTPGSTSTVTTRMTTSTFTGILFSVRCK